MTKRWGWLPALMLAGCASEPTFGTTVEELANAPTSAVFVPADYDGDGFTDLAVKSPTGVWYIDLARCSSLTGAAETNCTNFVDDDNDGLVNDGCPPVGAGELATGADACDPIYQTVNDNDNDGLFNDGCPKNRSCIGVDGFGGRWDFAFAGYGDATAIPVPADYGSLAGPADGKADLAIKDAGGMWAIDYADNGFGKFDVIRYGYGNATAVPMPADYDGDGRADLAIWTTNGGTTYREWRFDYSRNGFNGWDLPCTACPCFPTQGAGVIGGYGTTADQPAVGRFDNDVCADLSIKTTTGLWYFDLAATGFGGWDSPCAGCPVPLSGYGSGTAIVADYDSDGRTDLAIKDASGYWGVDFAADGFGAWNTWPFYYGGWGGGAATFIPGHYASTTGNLDQAMKSANGGWYLDKASNGYGNLDESNDTSFRPVWPNYGHAYINSTTVSWPISPYTCGNGACDSMENCTNCRMDCACSPSEPATGGNFHELGVNPLTLKIGVRYTANVELAPGSYCSDSFDNDSDGLINDGCPPMPEGTSLAETACGDNQDNDGDGYINDGCPAPANTPGEPDIVALKVNPDAAVSPSLNMANIGGHTVSESPGPVVYTGTRRYGFTCSEYGAFRIGFMPDNGFNPDYGLDVFCTYDRAGIYGYVVDKRTGIPISGVLVKVGALQYTTSTDGLYHFPSLTGGPHTITMTKTGWSTIKAVNVRVPGYPVGQVGIQVDAPMDIVYDMPIAKGEYTTYIDYARGRTILHTLKVNVAQVPITLGKAPAANGHFTPMKSIATSQGSLAMINGIWWMTAGANYVQAYPVNAPQACTPGGPPAICCDRTGEPVETTRAIGYLYMNGYVSPGKCEGGVCRPSDIECASGNHFTDPSRPPGSPAVLQAPWQLPMFGISGTGTSQRARIILTDSDFLRSTNKWRRLPAANVPGCPAGNTCPVYDDPAVSPNNASDFRFAFQMGHLLLNNGLVMARGINSQLGTAFPAEFAFARTTIGVNSAGTTMWFVIADGEGIDGGHGGTPSQLGEFYRDVLGASTAMIVDSGESTELVLKSALGQRRVNILSSENHAADSSLGYDYIPSGEVFGYIKVGP